MVSMRYAAVPISQVCVECYPFMVHWLRNFFERELLENKYTKLDIDNDEPTLSQIKNPESFYNDVFIKKAIDRFVKDPSSRYDPIPVPTYDNKPHYLIFRGQYMNVPAEQSGLVNRRMTWTDLLFIAANEVVKGKHIMVTRYPILDQYGIFFARIRVSSTLATMPMMVGSEVYKWYPVIDLKMNKSAIGNNFVDTLRFCNSFLDGMDGD